MNIAVIGYGSLVNQLHSPVYNQTLQVEAPQQNGAATAHQYNIAADSPFVPAENLKLPVRLGRISAANTEERRITAVIDDHASDEVVFYAKSKFSNLNEAIKNLREREGISAENNTYIGYVNLRMGNSRSRSDTVAQKVHTWAHSQGFDAVIWTDLPSKGVQFGPQSTGREILPLLDNNETLLKNTAAYIRLLPTQPNKLQKEILYRDSLVADFAQRDAMPQTDVPRQNWFRSQYGTWGPVSCLFSKPIVPQGTDPVQWKRDRIIAAAKHFRGLPYKRADGARGHFPARGCGLDCSNFVAWVYNYALGIRLSSDVDRLVASDQTGRKLAPGESLKKGDLLFIAGNPKHVVMYIDENHVIDSTSSKADGVQVRDMRLNGNKWYRPTADNSRFICARRVIE
jgi:cell wall-associated NlpC family hydrolase